MRKLLRTLALASFLLGPLATGSLLYADDDHESHGSMTERGMMGGHGTGMMKQMSQMMDQCSAMMQGGDHRGGRPNEQWRNR
jgi:hypothetical protein